MKTENTKIFIFAMMVTSLIGMILLTALIIDLIRFY